MTKVAKLIGHIEGADHKGSQPWRKHNPGDLRHSPHSSHAGEGPNDIGIIDTDTHGWEDLERQLKLMADRGLTLRQTIYQWAPPTENSTEAYLLYVTDGLGMPPDTLLSDALKVSA